MDKDQLKGKLQDFVVFIICIGAILGIAYYTGFLKGFTPADFQDAFNRIVKNAPNAPQISKTSRGVSTRYNGYTPSRIPKEVLRGSKNSRVWQNIFYTNKKTIFYVYSDNSTQVNSTDFHNNIQNYLSKSSARSSYNIVAQPYYLYKNMLTGAVSSYSICNSLEECNAQKQRATDHSAMSNFMDRCAKTMCIFNPQKGQYVVLKTKNYNDAVNMINKIKNW